jgi:hypothetical protein
MVVPSEHRETRDLPKRHFTRAVKYNMLEIHPALCADRVRAPSRSHSHSWLCSRQRVAPAVRDRVTAPGSALLRTAGSRHSRATYLESHYCTSKSAANLESYSCKNSWGVPPPTASIQLGAVRVPHPSVSRVRFLPARSRGGVNLTTPLLRAPNLPKMGFTAACSGAELSIEFRGLRAHEAASPSPLESALAQKWGWGYPLLAGSYDDP